MTAFYLPGRLKRLEDSSEIREGGPTSFVWVQKGETPERAREREEAAGRDLSPPREVVFIGWKQ